MNIKHRKLTPQGSPRLAMISYLFTSSCTSNHILAMNMEIKQRGRKRVASLRRCISSELECVCLYVWRGKNRTERLDSALRNPQTAHQHKSITIHCGPADLKYNKLSQQLCEYVCALSMFHDWNIVCDTWCRMCVCVRICDIWRRALIPYRLLLCLLAVGDIMLPLLRPTSLVPPWTAVFPKQASAHNVMDYFLKFALPFRAV